MHNKLRNYFWATAMTMVLTVLPGSVRAQPKQTLKNYAAMVNESAIKREDFDRAVTQIEQRFTQMGRPLNSSQMSELKKNILEKLINHELLLQESHKAGVKVADQEVKTQIDQMKSQYASDAEFKRALNMMGFATATLESQIREGLEIRQFVNDRIAKTITIPEKEIKASYDSHPHIFKRPESVLASHILIKVDPAANAAQKAEARKEIAKIEDKLKQGEDFANLAKTYSQGPSSTKGGDLGYFSRGQMVKPFEAAAFALKPGEVSGIVETRFGYHLIKVFDKKPQTIVPYEEAKDRIAQYLKNREIQQQVNQYVDALKKKASIKRFVIENP